MLIKQQRQRENHFCNSFCIFKNNRFILNAYSEDYVKLKLNKPIVPEKLKLIFVIF